MAIWGVHGRGCQPNAPNGSTRLADRVKSRVVDTGRYSTTNDGDDGSIVELIRKGFAILARAYIGNGGSANNRKRLRHFHAACERLLVHAKPTVPNNPDNLDSDDPDLACDGWFELIGEPTNVLALCYNMTKLDRWGDPTEYNSWVCDVRQKTASIRIPIHGSGTANAETMDRPAFREMIRQHRMGKVNRQIERSEAYAKDDINDDVDKPIIRHDVKPEEIVANPRMLFGEGSDKLCERTKRKKEEKQTGYDVDAPARFIAQQQLANVKPAGQSAGEGKPRIASPKPGEEGYHEMK